MRLDGTEIPVTDNGEMWVHFPEPGTRAMLPAWSIITGAMPDERAGAAVRDRIVFVGGSATGLQDLVATPVSKRVSPESRCTPPRRSKSSPAIFSSGPIGRSGSNCALVLLLGSALALLLPRLGAAKGALAALFGIGAVAAGSWLAFTQANYLLDPTYPMLALAVVYAVQTVAVFYREERQRRYIHSAFDRYLSPELVQPDRRRSGQARARRRRARHDAC